ncbi:MAG: hypothetical protein HY761_04705 [Candidatus Omnitrophica bacterium]|nr:hypothetical protein [Candidatus Omnitrophota bacterium]
MEPWATGFYRPITALSVSIDYIIWGLNPFGYNLTNLIYHVLVSVLFFLIMFSLTKGNLFIAWLSAIVFTTHPILANDVQVIPYRQDILPAFFMLLSFFLFLVYTSAGPLKKWCLMLSLLSFASALGSKETAIITPLIIFTYVIVFSNGQPYKEKLFKAVKVCLPFLLIAVLYVAWRTYLLHGIAGYGKSLQVSVSENIRNYFAYLLDPVERLHINIRHILSLLVLISLLYWGEIKRSFTDSIYGRLITLLLIWMLAPLMIFLFTLGFIDNRQAYIPSIPFSGIISVVFVRNLQSAINKIRVTPLSSLKNFTASAITLGLIAYLFIYSPLIKNYREVENCGKICKTVLNKLMEIVPALPPETTVHIYNLPVNVYPKGTTPITDGSCFENGNYKKFLNYYYPDNRVKLVPHYTIWNIDTDYPLNVNSDIKFEIKDKKDEGIVELVIKLMNDRITISQ